MVVDLLFGAGIFPKGVWSFRTLLSSHVVDEYSWRWIFYSDLPAALVAATPVLLLLPKDAPARQSSPPLDWKTIVLGALALGLWNYAWAS